MRMLYDVVAAPPDDIFVLCVCVCVCEIEREEPSKILLWVCYDRDVPLAQALLLGQQGAGGSDMMRYFL